MKSVHPNFATSANRHSGSWWVLAAALLAVAIWLVTSSPQPWDAVRTASIASPDVAPAKQTVTTLPSELRPYAADALRWHQAASFNMGEMLRQLEQAPVLNARVVAIELASAPARVQVDIECQSLAAAQALVVVLNLGVAGIDGRWRMLSFKGGAADSHSSATVSWPEHR